VINFLFYYGVMFITFSGPPISLSNGFSSTTGLLGRWVLRALKPEAVKC
jgi:hypothetical protein